MNIKDTITQMKLRDDGELLYLGTERGYVKVYQRSTKLCLRQMECSNSKINSVSISPDKVHFASGSDDGLVKLWNLSSTDPVRVIDSHSGGEGASMSKFACTNVLHLDDSLLLTTGTD